MASSRGMRKSPRNPSPMTNTVQATASPTIETNKMRERDDAGEDWVEPKLRAPAPSFEDHRGLERQGVLEQMAPLGTMPNQKLKLRVKQWEPPQKSTPIKREKGAGEVIATSGGKETENTERSRRSNSRRAEESNTRRSSAREKDDDTEYTPKATTRPSSSKSAAAAGQANSEGGPPDSSTPEGREILRGIVDMAVQRSKEVGNENLGLAIRKVFEESLHNASLSETLDAVLNQRASEEQARAFQTYIKVARKAIKAEKNHTTTSSTAGVSNDPAQRSTHKSSSKRPRRSASRNAMAEGNDNLTSTPSKRTRANGTLSHANGVDDGQRPSKKVKRSGSADSESSLSSTHSTDMEPEPEMSESNDLPSLRSRAGGPKLHTFSMAKSASNKRSHAAANATASKQVIDEDPADAELAAKKRKLEQVFDDYEVHDSHIREEPTPASRPKLQLSTFPKLQTPSTARNARAEEYEDPSSPASSFQGEFLVPPPPGALRAQRSRGTTPNALGRPKNPQRRMARVKMSPNKKKTGPAAAGRESSRLREREKDTGAAAADSDSGDGENYDYCNACNGNGELLCCDGCPRSFHLLCFDAPLSSPPEGEWLCFRCCAKRQPAPRLSRGLFVLPLEQIRAQNPKQFALKDTMRNYFEGMKTGEDGEYEEVSGLKPKPRSLDHDPHADKFKLKDSKGKFVLCYRCGKSSLGHREIINCDYCTLKWHLDCLDPPLANAPIRDHHNSNRARNSWMCPAHAPQELEGVGYSDGRTHKLRRPRNGKVVESQLSRGVKNSGVIEIGNDPSDDETGYDLEDNIIYRVTEKSIKLDFIDRVYQRREEALCRENALREAARLQARQEAAAVRNANIAFNNRHYIEKDAALSLAQLAQGDASIDLEGDQVQSLINALISNASDETIALITADEAEDTTKPAGPNGLEDGTNASSMAPTPPRSDVVDRTLSVKQKQSYLLLMDLIQKRLREAEEAE